MPVAGAGVGTSCQLAARYVVRAEPDALAWVVAVACQTADGVTVVGNEASAGVWAGRVIAVPPRPSGVIEALAQTSDSAIPRKSWIWRGWSGSRSSVTHLPNRCRRSRAHSVRGEIDPAAQRLAFLPNRSLLLNNRATRLRILQKH